MLEIDGTQVAAIKLSCPLSAKSWAKFLTSYKLKPRMIDAIIAKLFLFPTKFFIVKAQPINIIATKNKGCDSSE